MLYELFSIIMSFFLAFNDNAFLRDGQERGFFGIYDADGIINVEDTLMERWGYGGNPLYWETDEE